MRFFSAVSAPLACAFRASALMKILSLSLLSLPLFSSPQETLRSLTLEEKIGQLFIAPICPLRDDDHWADWDALLNDLHIGNGIVKQSDPSHQIQALNTLQTHSKYPLLIVADAEWGLAMRMSDTMAFPKNMTLGAIQDLSLLEDLGKEIGRQARLVGIHMNLAPVIDVNNNPNNPIIHMRSFGDDPLRVAKQGSAIGKGFVEGGLLACAKHFPGHGDTGIDSHYALPTIIQTLERLYSVEIPPFEAMIDSHVAAIMTAHILVPSLDPNLPATLSKPVLTDLLRQRLGFNGLIMTDALNMKALTDHFSPEEIALKAHAAGADLLLYGSHILPEVDALLRDSIPRAYRALLSAYQEGIFSIEKLDQSVLRILEAKETLQLFTHRTVAADPDLLTSAALSLAETLFAEAITHVGPQFTTSQVTVTLTQINPRAERFGLSLETTKALQTLADTTNLTICLYGTPYALRYLPKNASIFIAYEDDPRAHQAMTEVLEGKRTAKGSLPIELL